MIALIIHESKSFIQFQPTQRYFTKGNMHFSGTPSSRNEARLLAIPTSCSRVAENKFARIMCSPDDGYKKLYIYFFIFKAIDKILEENARKIKYVKPASVENSESLIDAAIT